MRINEPDVEFAWGSGVHHCSDGEGEMRSLHGMRMRQGLSLLPLLRQPPFHSHPSSEVMVEVEMLYITSERGEGKCSPTFGK